MAEMEIQQNCRNMLPMWQRLYEVLDIVGMCEGLSLGPLMTKFPATPTRHTTKTLFLSAAIPVKETKYQNARSCWKKTDRISFHIIAGVSIIDTITNIKIKTIKIKYLHYIEESRVKWWANPLSASKIKWSTKQNQWKYRLRDVKERRSSKDKYAWVWALNWNAEDTSVEDWNITVRMLLLSQGVCMSSCCTL